MSNNKTLYDINKKVDCIKNCLNKKIDHSDILLTFETATGPHGPASDSVNARLGDTVRFYSNGNFVNVQEGSILYNFEGPFEVTNDGFIILNTAFPYSSLNTTLNIPSAQIGQIFSNNIITKNGITRSYR